MKSKKLLLALLPLVGVLGLASCGGGDDKPAPQPDVPSVDCVIKEKTEIVLSTTAGKSNQAILEKYIAEFAKIEPNVTVVNKKFEGNYASLANNVLSGFATGEHPDMTLVYPDAVADFIDYGFGYKLDKYIDDPEIGWTAEDKADFLPKFLDEGKKYVIPGTFSLPFSKSTEVIYYDAKKVNNLVLEGVNGGNPINEDYMNNLTWEEFFGVLCPAMMKYAEANPTFLDTTNPDGYAILGYDSDANLFISMAEQYGIPYTSVTESGKGSADFKTEETRKLLTKMNEWTKKHYLLTQKGTGKRANDFFKTNSVIFSVGSTGGASYQYNDKDPKKIAVAPIPQAKGKDKKVILQGPSMAFLRHKKGDGWDENRQKASWLFYKFMTEQKNAAKWAFDTNYLPIRQSIYDSADYKETYDEANAPGEASFDALTCRIATLASTLNDAYFTSSAFKGSNTCRTAVEAMVGKACTITNNAADAQTWIDAAINDANKAIGA